MTQTQSEYKTAADTDNAVRCQSCDGIIGSYILGENKRTYILIGGVMLYSAHGICQGCGAEWHWCWTDKTLEKLTKRRANS